MYFVEYLEGIKILTLSSIHDVKLLELVLLLLVIVFCAAILPFSNLPQGHCFGSLCTKSKWEVRLQHCYFGILSCSSMFVIFFLYTEKRKICFLSFTSTLLTYPPSVNFQVMPEKYLFGRRPPFPLFNKKITITVGDPIEFDLPKMSEMAMSMSKDCSSSSSGWPSATRFGLNEAAQKCLYSNMSKQIWVVMENLRNLGKTFLKQND